MKMFFLKFFSLVAHPNTPTLLSGTATKKMFFFAASLIFILHIN